MSDHERLNKIETVEAGGRTFTGPVFHVRPNGWACVETLDGYIASGPAPTPMKEEQ